MKTFNRNNLPEFIKYNKRVYRVNSNPVANKCLTIVSDDIVKTLELMLNKHIVIVNVLSKHLKGRTDLHDKLYEPTHWIFISDSSIYPMDSNESIKDCVINKQN